MNFVLKSVCVAAACGLCATAIAEPVEWLDPVDGSWLDPTRWSTGSVPGASSDVVIGVEGPGYEIVDATGSVQSLTLASPVAVVAGGLEIAGALSSLGTSLQTLTGNWSIDGIFNVGAGSSIIWERGSDVSVSGVSQNAGSLFVLGSATVFNPRHTLIQFDGGFNNDGTFSLGAIPPEGHTVVPTTVEVTGDLINTGTIRSFDFSPSLLRVNQGRLVNAAGAAFSSARFLGRIV